MAPRAIGASSEFARENSALYLPQLDSPDGFDVESAANSLADEIEVQVRRAHEVVRERPGLDPIEHEASRRVLTGGTRPVP